MPQLPLRADADPPPHWRASTWQLLLAALALLTFLIHGYHPLAEDGGLYVAGVQYTLDPSLFPHYTAFVREHLRFSLFAPVLAALVHLTHLPLAWLLFAVELFSLWLLFYAARKLLQRCFSRDTAQLFGLALLAVWATLPVAGTSLLLVDPYLTARSLSTPLSLLAIAFALDAWPSLLAEPTAPAIRVPHLRDSTFVAKLSWRSRLENPLLGCFLCLILAALFHPLMAAYALALIIFLRAARLRHRARAFTGLALFALILAAIVHALAPPESSAILAASYSRYYWFLSQWRWFELFGLAGPLLVLALLLRSARKDATQFANTTATLCRACIALGLTATLIALLFARESERTHLVARLQPLRTFLPIYAIMVLLLGATLAQRLLHAHRRVQSRSNRAVTFALPAMCLAALAAIMFLVQRETFPASPHIELPWQNNAQPHMNPHMNPWTAAFLWARANTPRDSLFALDARYINQPGEDAQTFRATALRSALPDFSKDGGEAAITPSLAALWQHGAAAQANLSTESDSLRDARLRPLGVTWMVLHSSAPTQHPCPYTNTVVKICRLGP
jgi:hypothetical protein